MSATCAGSWAASGSRRCAGWDTGWSSRFATKAPSRLQVTRKHPAASFSHQPDRTGRAHDSRREGSTVSGLNQDVLRAIEIERLRRAKEARRARGLGR